jgi:hypothetical protein
MLRRITPAILIFTLISVASLGAFTNTSFRNASTATLLEDDYDLWLGPYPLPDPARLTLIDGSRLYTNLSNLVNKTEEPFSNTATDYFLIGGSTTPLFNFGNLGIVVDRFNDKNPFNTGLTDRYGNYMYGYGHAVDAVLVDEDLNGTYDRRYEVEETAEAWIDNGTKEGVLCFGKDMDAMKFGLFYQLTMMNTEEYGLSGISPVNFTFDSSSTNLISGVETYTRSTIGTGSTNDDMTEHLFGLSFWRYLSDVRAVGLHFGYGMFSGTYLDVWDVNDDWDGSPDDPSITDTYSMTESSSEDAPFSGNTMTGWLSYIDDWNEITHLRFDAYYNRSSFELDGGAVNDYSISEARYVTNGSSYTNNGTENTPLTGDGAYQTIAARGKVIYDLTDRVTFAFGMGFLTTTHDTTRNENTTASYTYVYDDGDTQANDPDDYTRTTTFGYEQQIMTTDVTNNFMIPVCLEFNVIKPLDFRLGTIHTITLFDHTTNCDLLSYTEPLVHTVYGDGSESYSIPDTSFQDIGTSEESVSTSSNTVYTYGMGYRVSDNLQIDLMGFYDLTDLYNWRVSATLSF